MEVQIFCRVSYPDRQILQFPQETRLFPAPSTRQEDPDIPAAEASSVTVRRVPGRVGR